MNTSASGHRLRIAFIHAEVGGDSHLRAHQIARWLDPAEFEVSLVTQDQVEAHREVDFVVSFGPYALQNLAVVHPQRRLIGTSTPCEVSAMDLLLDGGYAFAGFANSRWQQQRSRHQDRIYYLPNGVDEDRFTPCPEAPREFAACWVGNGESDDEAGIEIVREATQRAGVPLHVPESGKRHALSPEEFRDQVYHRSAFYICMSLFEGTPTAGLEALACGLPVISTPVGNLQDLVRDEHNGLLIERSVEALADAIGRLRELDYDQLRRNARESILDGWRWSQQAQRYAHMFRELAAKRSAAFAPYPPVELGRHQNRLLEFEHFHSHSRHLEKRRLGFEWKDRQQPLRAHRPTGNAVQPIGSPAHDTEDPSRMRRVLVVANNPRSPSAPNIWLTRVLPLLRPEGFDPEVLFFRYDDTPGFIGEELENAGLTCHYRRFTTTEENVRDVCEVIAERSPSILINNVNVAAYFAGPWVRAAGIQTIGVLRSDDAFHHDLLAEFFDGEERWRVDAGVGVSKYLAGAIEKAGMPALDCPSGAPLPDFWAEPPAERFSLTYAGRLVDEQKRVSEVVASILTLAASDRRFEATLYGTGPLLEPLRERVAAAGLSDRVQLPGMVRPDQLQRHLAKHHAFVLLSDYEGLSTSLLEGMAVGLVPIIRDMRSGSDEVVHHGENGLVVTDRTEGFLAAVRAVAADPARWTRLSKAARATVARHYSSQVCAQRWAGFLRQLGQPSPRQPLTIPALETIQLPSVRPNPKGMAREDRRREPSGSESAKSPALAGHDPFVNPVLHANFADSYWTRHSILAALKRHLPLFHGTFLDVGCGVMPYRDLIMGSPARVEKYIGMDIETEIYRAEVDLRWDGQSIPLEDHSVDSAMATEVLEHCPEPLTVLKEIRRVLKPGGTFFFTVPFVWPLHDAPWDFHRYTPFQLERLLQRAGFEDHRVESLGGWNASLAQMIGLWFKRAPMSPAKREAMAKQLFPLYQQLVESDELPADVHAGNTMSTGWCGTATVSRATDATVTPLSGLRLGLVRSHFSAYSETFLDDHARFIAEDTVQYHGHPWPVFTAENRAVIGAERYERLRRTDSNREQIDLVTEGLAEAWKAQGIDVILAESGYLGACVYRACLKAGIPYIVHFHGADAFVHDLVDPFIPDFHRFFRSAASIVVVSEAMRRRVIELGADPDTITVNPCGVEVPPHPLADPARMPPHFLTVGRFVEKKGPDKTLRAFAQAYREHPGIRLTMVGDGPLLAECQRLVHELGLGEAVHFAGVLSRGAVQNLMCRSRAFLQHSVIARNGDSEGMPVAVMESGALGLPTVATRHAGIPDAVRDDEDGFLVDEGDIDGMAEAILVFARDPGRSAMMGRSFHHRIATAYSRAVTIGRLQHLATEARSRGPQRLAQAREPLSEEQIKRRMQRLRHESHAMELAREAKLARSPQLESECLLAAIGFNRNNPEAYLRLAALMLGSKQEADAFLCLREASRTAQVPAEVTRQLKQLQRRAVGDPMIETYLRQAGGSKVENAERRRRILIFTNLLPPQEMGGYGRTIWEFADLLMKRGHSVRILTGDLPHLAREPVPGYERVERHTRRELQLYGDWRGGRTVSESDESRIRAIARHNFERVAAEIEAFGPDACIAGNIDFLSPLPIYAALKRDLPVLHRLGNANPGYEANDTPKDGRYCIASCSDWVNRGLRDQGYAPSGGFEILHPGSPLEHYYRPFAPRFDRLRICFAGLLQPYKGAQVLVQALSLLKRMGIPFRAELAGEATDPAFLSQLQEVASTGGFANHVKFPGFLSRDGLAALYARSNVMVFPSVFEEPFGKSQIEAMAAGLAVVTSGTGGSPEIVQDERNGLHFKNNDPQDLARQLFILQANPELWARLAAQGQADAFQFTTLNSVLKIEEIFDRLEPVKPEA